MPLPPTLSFRFWLIPNALGHRFLHLPIIKIKLTKNNVSFDYINIYTDSEYSIKSLTEWIKNWKKNNWKNANNKDVANQDIIKKIDKYLQKYKGKIFFHHVRSHTGKSDYKSMGNTIADKLATEGAKKNEI